MKNALKTHVRNFCLLGFVLLGQMLFAQTPEKYPQSYFRYPLGIQPPSFSGNFGEIRGNHFHAGNDYRTLQREGFPVYAAADGYISRIKTSAFGYGHGLYITHPNGFVTVYGHLRAYSPKIEKLNFEVQSLKQSFEIDTLLSNTQIKVTKGEIIGYSGNTGGSGGPHLHFEIRDEKTENPINPQLFGLTVSDIVAPYLSTLYIYDLGNEPFSDQTRKRGIYLRKVGNSFQLAQPKVIPVSETSGFGLITYDASSGNIGRNGTYQVEMYLDDSLVFQSRTDQFSFANSRAVNSFMDYPAYIQSKLKIQKSFIEPNNPLNVYPDKSKHGKIHLSDNRIHKIKYITCDTKGNVSSLAFEIQKNQAPKTENHLPKLSYQTAHHIEKEGAMIDIPKDALYDDIYFYVRKNASAKHNYSAVYQIFTKYMPLQKDIEVKIPVNELPVHLTSKALLVDEKGSAYGGTYQDGMVSVKSKNFGTYQVAVDTIAPKIIPINISSGKNMSKISKIIFKVRDDLSGIAKYKAFIDGNWVLMEYDAKTATMYHVFSSTLERGLHQFDFEVTDQKNNLSKFTTTFIK